jgi:hypothetical protein
VHHAGKWFQPNRLLRPQWAQWNGLVGSDQSVLGPATILGIAQAAKPLTLLGLVAPAINTFSAKSGWIYPDRLPDRQVANPCTCSNHLTRKLVTEHAWRANGKMSLHNVNVCLAYAGHDHA